MSGVGIAASENRSFEMDFDRRLKDTPAIIFILDEGSRRNGDYCSS
jgi:hypothetical protein